MTVSPKTRILAAAMLVGLPTLAQADSTADLIKIFGRDPGLQSANACFIRHYTRAHLASHPRQNVTSKLVYVNKQQGPDGYYNLNMQVNFRQLKKPFQVSGSCSKEADGKHSLGCGIDCDGGSMAVRVKNETSLLVEIPDSVRVYDPSSDADAPDADLPTGARFGNDDKLFRLDRTSLKDCAPVISDEAVKAQVMQGKTMQ